MSVIRFTPFGGLIPKSDPSMLPAPAAQIANNCRFSSGQLEAYNSPSHVMASGVHPTVTMYRFNQASSSETNYWFLWNKDVNCVKGAIANDTEERTIYTGDGYPKITKSDLALSSQPYPGASYRLGLPVPVSAPIVAVTGAYAPSAIPESRAYIYTFADDMGQESPPSPASGLIDWYPASTDTKPGTAAVTAVAAVAYVAAVPYSAGPPVVLATPEVIAVAGVTGVAAVAPVKTEFPAQTTSLTLAAPPSGNFSITKRRLYRTSTGNTGTDFLFVCELPAATLTYTDTVLGAALAEPCPTIGTSNLPDNAQGLVAMPNGIMAAFMGYDVYFSEAFKPHSYPDSCRQTVGFPIIGLGVFGTSLAILTTGYPEVATGGDPQSMSLEKVPFMYACLSKRSICTAQGGVIYAGADGLIQISSNGPVVLTDALFTRREWQTLNPSSMLCCVWDERIFMFYDTGTVQGGYILDATNGLTTTDVFATAAYTDPVTNALFLVVNGNVVKWDGGAVGQFHWKSRRDVQAQPKNFAYGQVLATAYPVTLKVYADDVLTCTQIVTSELPFRLPSGFRARYWELELLGAGRILSAVLADSSAELQNV